MQSWTTSSIESWESGLFSRRYRLYGVSSSSSAEIGVPIDYRRVSEGIAGVA